MNEKEIAMLQNLIDEFESKGIDVTQANYGGYSKPDVIKHHRPDVIGWNEEKKVFNLGKIMTKEELNKKESTGQLVELSSIKMTKGPSKDSKVPLFLGVPKDAASDIMRTIDSKGVSRSNIYTIEVEK